jgi:predicted enzyme related to lactoylglutathione lyase
MDNEPTYGNGKICYLEIPAGDVHISSAFYHDVFGWKIRTNNEGNPSFDDGVNQVSGTWVAGAKPAGDAVIIISVMVDDIYDTISLVEKYGGKIILAVDENISEKFARFTDPYGNIMGLYQHTS